MGGVRPGDAGYNRAALDACVGDLTGAPVDIEVESSWTLSDGFCVVYRHRDRPSERVGYCARAVPAAEFADPVEWGEGVAVELWDEPPSTDTVTYDAHGIGWHGALDGNPPALPGIV
jgi:hypothetical protein